MLLAQHHRLRTSFRNRSEDPNPHRPSEERCQERDKVTFAVTDSQLDICYESRVVGRLAGSRDSTMTNVKWLVLTPISR